MIEPFVIVTVYLCYILLIESVRSFIRNISLNIKDGYQDCLNHSLHIKTGIRTCKPPFLLPRLKN